MPVATWLRPLQVSMCLKGWSACLVNILVMFFHWTSLGLMLISYLASAPRLTTIWLIWIAFTPLIHFFNKYFDKEFFYAVSDSTGSWGCLQGCSCSLLKIFQESEGDCCTQAMSDWVLSSALDTIAGGSQGWSVESKFGRSLDYLPSAVFGSLSIDGWSIRSRVIFKLG